MGEFNDPETGRFVRGNTANPGGRPKGRTVSAELRSLIEREVGGQGDPIAKVLAAVLIKIATSKALMATDPKVVLAAIKEIADRTEGKPVQAIANSDDGPLEIRVVYADDHALDPPTPPGPGDDPPGDASV